MMNAIGVWLIQHASAWELAVVLTGIALAFAVVGKISYRQGFRRGVRSVPKLEYVPPKNLRVQIATKHGPLFDADTDWLYNQARYIAFSQCGYSCLPRCQEHGWYPLFEDADGLVMRVRPVH